MIGILLGIMSIIIIVCIPVCKISDHDFYHDLCVAKMEQSCTYCCKKDLVFATFATHVCTGDHHGLVIVSGVPLYVHSKVGNRSQVKNSRVGLGLIDLLF